MASLELSWTKAGSTAPPVLSPSLLNQNNCDDSEKVRLVHDGSMEEKQSLIKVPEHDYRRRMAGNARK
jgi:hypothetical protein